MADDLYDRVPYQSKAYPQAHPETLAAMGRLFGMATAPIGACRVIEIGCNAGGNLLPMACALPSSRFVGIDPAPDPIAAARRSADELGLSNVEFLETGLPAERDWGTFDYVVCHGVFSWVPPGVRTAILAFCERHLAPNGIAYVSYNTNPGWKIRGLLREMQMFHIAGFDDPAERLAQARALGEFLAQHVSPKDVPYKAAVDSEAKRVRGLPDWYVFHDNLSPENDAFWFHEFVALADAYGLQYLGDAAFQTMILANLEDRVRDALTGLAGEQVRTEQYMDFVTGRCFRQTLLCRRDVTLERALDWRSIRNFRFQFAARPVGDVDAGREGEAVYRVADGYDVVTEVPLVKAVLNELSDRRPASLTLDELIAASRRRLGAEDDPRPEQWDEDREVLGQKLLQIVAKGPVLLRLADPPFATAASERPVVWPYARWQAGRGLDHLTNPRGENVATDAFDRFVAARLDGTRDKDGLLAELLAAVEGGELGVRFPNGPPPDAAERRRQVLGMLAETVALFVRVGLMAAS